MRYSRSYKVEYSQEEKRIFTRIIYSYLVKGLMYSCRNNYPYDKCYNGYSNHNIESLHYTIFYPRNTPDEVLQAEKYIREGSGFSLQENEKKDKSILQYEHFHAIKVLSWIGEPYE